MLVYFSGSAREIERDIKIYRLITKSIHETGAIIVNNWTETAATRELFPADSMWWKEMCTHALQGIEDADVVVMEATGVSTFGVGYELATALNSGKKVLVLVKKGDKRSYVRGLSHPHLKVAFYTPEDVSSIVNRFLQRVE